MKRTLSLLLSAALLLCPLAACGEQPQPSEEPSPTVSLPSTLDPAASPIAPAAELSVIDLAETVLPYSGHEDPENVERINAQTDAGDLDFYIENAYKLDKSAWADAAVIRATGASAFEVAVLRFDSEDAAAQTAEALKAYRNSREADFFGYAPAQADMVHSGLIRQEGTWVGLFLCPDPGAASSAFQAALEDRELPALPGPSETPGEQPSETPGEQPSETPGGQPSETPSEQPAESPSEMPPAEPSELPGVRPTESPSETPGEQSPAEPSELPILPSPAPAQYPGRTAFDPPNKDDMSLYDTSAILAAWKSGDTGALTDQDKAVYNAAAAVLDQVVKQDMTAYQKESAVYQWIVQNINYDWTHNNVMVSTPRESFTPYGGLVSRSAVCLGYATAFQLLMDMLDIECITVVGAAAGSEDDHAWNMVKLDGNWYCADPTWDANWREDGITRGLPSEWRYFNVTSDYMAASNHQWDYNNIPEATTMGYGQ